MILLFRVYMKKIPENNLKNNLKRLSQIADWFDAQEQVDIEESLEKVKEAVVLIAESKKRLEAIENEFEEVKKDLEE